MRGLPEFNVHDFIFYDEESSGLMQVKIRFLCLFNAFNVTRLLISKSCFLVLGVTHESEMFIS